MREEQIPIIEMFEKEGNVSRIDADRTEEEVYESVKAELNL